ncbi:MAG: sigma 54-interacting transcriptional regulator [Planctomycetaceae bacterium]
MPRRSRKTQDLATWLGTSLTPLFVLDTERRIRVFNAGCQALTGWTPPDVVGEVCQYTQPVETATGTALAASLCPPPEVFAGQEMVVPGQILTHDGNRLNRSLHFFPLRDGETGITGVLGLICPPQPPAELAATPMSLRLHAELAALRASQRRRFGPQTLIAVSRGMQRVAAQIALAIPTQSSVLLQGEPGTGREHLSRVIHFGGPGAGRWYVPLDCRRLTPTELERVLNRLVELHPGSSSSGGTAPPGTLYLADVDHLPRDLQKRLCQLVASPDGDDSAPRLRILASTEHPWQQLVQEERLLEDLAIALTPLVIELPPLRERREDIPLLAQHFLEELNRLELHGERRHQVSGLTDDAIQLLIGWTWPRHLDELWDLLRSAHSHATGTQIGIEDLPAWLKSAPSTPPPMAQLPQLDLDQILLEAERKVVALALNRCRQNRTRAAAMLGIQRTRLLRRLEVLGLSCNQQPIDEDHTEPQSTTGSAEPVDEAAE